MGVTESADHSAYRTLVICVPDFRDVVQFFLREALERRKMEVGEFEPLSVINN